MPTFRVIALLAAVCIGFVVYLTVLAEAGLGDLPGETSKHVDVAPQEAAPAPSANPSVPGQLTEVAKNVKYQSTKLQAPAGKVTIVFQNQDSTAHNFHLFTAKGGQSLGMTDVGTGPATSQLSVDLQAGKYYFQCDVHPDQMSGELDVQ